ncbi:putative phage abortive infection protein [Photobacterium swingsii]|uniref:putative phage abortive infection protein n=1 Tax=Photobacterium swingsii TaxID=680026 RepID=UPI00352EA498
MKLLNFISKESFIFTLIAIGVIGTAVGGVFFLWQEPLFVIEAKINSEKIAQFGDFIGGFFGSIWALAGVFLFYKALTEQRRDFANNKEALDLQVDALNHQIEEFKLSRDEQVLNRKVYEDQSRTLKIQQFESNFYSLLNVYINIKNQFNAHDGEFFKTLLSEIRESYSQEYQHCQQHDEFIEKYLEVHDSNREKLSNYFRSLYRIITIIDDSKFLKPESKFFYAKIVRAQISDYELIVISLNAHTYWGEKLKKHILKYNLLKHLPIFCKPEFEHYASLQIDNKLLLFSEELDRFLIKHVDLYYSIESDIDKVEEKFTYFDVIVGIYFNEDIRITIYCNNDIAKNGVNLNDEHFQSFLNQYIFEKTIVQTYLSKKRVNITTSLDIKSQTKEFNIIISSEDQIRLNRDEY